MNKLIEQTSGTDTNYLWAEIDGVTYGISESFDLDTLMDEDGIPYHGNMSQYDKEEIAESIQLLVKKN